MLSRDEKGAGGHLLGWNPRAILTTPIRTWSLWLLGVELFENGLSDLGLERMRFNRKCPNLRCSFLVHLPAPSNPAP